MGFSYYQFDGDSDTGHFGDIFHLRDFHGNLLRFRSSNAGKVLIHQEMAIKEAILQQRIELLTYWQPKMDDIRLWIFLVPSQSRI